MYSVNDDTLSVSDAPPPALERVTPGTDLTGTLLEGRYQIESILGEGGMGAVYRAWEQGVTKREVAVKVILPHRAHQAGAAARFKREAGLAARLSHPNTVRVLAFGETAEGLLYLVTEFLRGRPLSDAMRSGPMALDRALEIAIQTTRSLSEAHAQGLVHRDLKPDNIFLMSAAGVEDFVKVIDFGLATEPDVDQRLTQTGAAIGTPAYMAPEQVQGQSVTPAADVYAVGILLFEMVTGARPFTGSTAFELMTAQLMETPPLLDAERPYPAELVTLVSWCLDKRPEARPRDADQLRQALEGVRGKLGTDVAQPVDPADWRVDPTEESEALPSVAVPPPTAEQSVSQVPGSGAGRRWPAGAVVVAVALLGLLAWWRPWQVPPPEKTRGATPGSAQSVGGKAPPHTAPITEPAVAARAERRAPSAPSGPTAQPRAAAATSGQHRRGLQVGLPIRRPRPRPTIPAPGPTLKTQDFDKPGDGDMLDRLRE